MFDLFDDDVREVFGYARQEAQRLCHDHIAVEHMLLGVARKHASLLQARGIEPEQVRQAMTPGTAVLVVGQIPFTAEMKKLLEGVFADATERGLNRIEVERLVEGAVRLGYPKPDSG